MTTAAVSTTLKLPLQRVLPRAMGFCLDERAGYLRAFGRHSQSFTTLQPGLSYFDMPGVGYIAFAEKWGMTYAFADPVCEEAHTEQLLDAFLATHPDAYFVQVSPPVMAYLTRKYGLYGTQMGSEMRVDLQTWSISGSSKKTIRQAVNQAKAQGIEVRESAPDARTHEVSERWLKTRACQREIRFLIRPTFMPFRQGTRHFYAYQNGEPVGFAFFDPVYRNGRVVGYIPNVSRACETFKQGLWYALVIEAIEVFRREGVEFLDLGLMPMVVTPEVEAQESKALRRVVNMLYRHGNSLYNFQGLEFAKQRFKGEMAPTYCCHRHSLPLIGLLAMFRMTRII